MQVWDENTEAPGDWPESVVTIGVFDGVHRGHRQLIRHTVETARVLGKPSAVLTFSPSPAEVLSHGDPPTRLATMTQRLRLIESLGVDAVYVLPFTTQVAAMSPGQFAGSVLSDRLHACRVVVGENFRFGHKARGDVGLLATLGSRLGFDVDPAHLLRSVTLGAPISSTVIRKFIADGDVAAATRALARPHRVEGVVVRGDGRGSGLGFPTANLEPTANPTIPDDGVYAGRLVLDPYGSGRQTHAAAISVGTNPTFDGPERRIEAFALDAPNLSIYDRQIAIDFVARIRGQEKFASADALTRAIAADERVVRELLGS